MVVAGVADHDWRPAYWSSHAFAHKRNASKINKPVADVATPLSGLKQNDWLKRHGVGLSFAGIVSMQHFTLSPELVPYTTSYSTWDCCFQMWLFMHAVWCNHWLGKKSSGNVNPTNPRTAWAHKVVLWTSVARINAAWLFGVCGYFYSYEMLYTHFPPTRIADPSPEGWKQPWKDGQTTYGARFLSTFFIPLAFIIWRGKVKRASAVWAFFMFHAMYYELGRHAVFPGTVNTFGYYTGIENKIYERHGQLVPQMNKTVDADTNRPSWAQSYELLRFSHSRNVRTCQENQSHDYQPGRLSPGVMIRNHYYNFQKAAQMDADFKARWRSDTFQLPNVMHSHMASGALDSHDSAAAPSHVRVR